MAAQQKSFPRPALELDALNRAYWTAGASGRLHLARCGTCERHHHPPVPVCPHCLSPDVSAQPVSGRGHVYGFTINERQWTSDLPARYVVALVSVAEDPEILLPTNIVGCDPDDVRIGMPVEVLFDDQGDQHVPLFRPEAR